MTDDHPPHDTWRCFGLTCDAHGTGTAAEVEKAAERHTKVAKHATCTFHAGSGR